MTIPRQPRVDLLDRIGRPLLRICGVLFVIVVIWFVVRIMGAIVMAYDRAAETGTAVPSMDGGLAGILGVIASSLPVLIPMVLDQVTRHRERLDQQARGRAPNRPFDSPTYSAPPEGGPRPGDSA